MRPIFAIAVLALLLVGSQPADARTWSVPSPETPTIAIALDSATYNMESDTILVAAGTYYEAQMLALPESTYLAGVTGNPGDVVIDGQGARRVMYVSESQGVVIRHLTLRNGRALGSGYAGNGGGLKIEGGANALVENCVFEDDSAQVDGGGFSCEDNASATFRHCVFRGNGAGNRGGGMMVDQARRTDSHVTLDSCLFELNFSEGPGGGVCCIACELVASGTQFLNNRSGERGGALDLYSASANLSDCYFAENEAAGNGGALYADFSTVVAIDPFFTQNVAQSGGGVYLANTSDGALHWGNFTLNHALGSAGGGAIFLDASNTQISTTNFGWNTSAGPGGAVVILGPGGTASIDSCSFRNNEADSTGGAVFIHGNGGDLSPAFSRCVFASNQSPSGVAAVGVRSQANPSLFSCTIAENDPVNTGGSSLGCFNNSSIGLDHCIVAFAVSGTAVSCGGESSVYVSCTDIYGNPNGDWDGCLAEYDSINGNFSADPMFCGPEASPYRPHQLQGASPCASDTCGLIGGEDVGCGFLKNWVGEGDGLNWEDPENWDPVGVPGPNDDVHIALPGMESVYLSSPAAVFRLTVGGPGTAPALFVTSDTLEIGHDGSNFSDIEIQEGAALALPTGVSFTNFPGANLRLTGGDVLGDGTLVNGGAMQKDGAAVTSRIACAFENRADDPGDGALHVREGTLEVDGFLTNDNLVRVYGAAVMRLDPGDGPLRTDVMTNSGLLILESGSELVLQTPTTVFLNEREGTVQLWGGNITGAGVFRNYGLLWKTEDVKLARSVSRISARLENLSSDPGDGAVRVGAGELTVEAEFDNAGSLYVYTSAAMTLDPGEGPLREDLLTNTGVVIVRDGAALTIDPAGTVFWNTVTGEVRLEGTGEILGTGLLRNHGLFIKEDVAKSRAFGHVAVLFENVGEDPGDGALEVQDGGLWVEGELSNSGTISVSSGASLLLDPGEGPFREGSATERGERTNGTLTNAVGGTCAVNGSLAVAGGASLTNYGSVTVDSGASVVNDGVFDLRENGVLAGRGTFDNVGGSFTGAGVIRPGGSAGILTFLGDFSQTATGEIEIEIGGTAAGPGYDRLAISGTASLSGALYTTLTGGFTPVEGDSFAVITIGGGLLGRTDFDCFSGLDVPGVLFLEPVQVPAAFSLVARDSTVSNGPPVAGDDGDSTDAATPIVIHVLANDTDPEMSDLRIALVSTAGTSGTVAILPGDSLLQYTPVRSFSGQDALTYTVTDCYGGSDVATVTIGVARAPHAWLVPADALTIQAGLDSAWAKDTVVVGSGTYHEHNLVMKSGVVLRSETMDPASVVIDADSLGPVLQVYSCDSTTAVMGITFTGGNGTGVVCMNSSVTIDRCAFTGNANDLYGGGISLTSGRPVVRRCVFEGNRAQYGGAMLVSGAGSTALIESTLVVNNWAAYGGAAVIAWAGAHPTFRNCTIVGNTCPAGTAGFLVEGPAPTVVGIQNSILASNTSGPSSMVTWCALTTSIQLSCSDVYGNSGDDYGGCLAGQQGTNGNFSADPRFCQFGNADDPYALMSGSPCAPENNPSCGLVGAKPVGCGAVTAVEDAAPPAVAYRLFANRPNPFNPTTTIRFSLPRAERATLIVYDVAGRRVATIADGRFGPGEFDATWGGADEAGRDVASGIYFARIVAGEYTAVRKMILLR